MAGVDPGFWRNRRVFVTGHTGFKGAWLLLWLNKLGARIHGLALPPHTSPSLFALCAEKLCAGTYGDIADLALISHALAECEPEIVIHMAAQALVRPSYADPLGTFATNVMGTANLLQAVHAVPSVRAVVIVTSDKVYENDGNDHAYVETDRLGGHDPYSTSKACAELVTTSYRRCFYDGDCRVATARAGNVIGGGDWSPFRIVRDVVEAYEAGTPVALRNPQAVRPWQHVLDPLAGYLMLAQTMVAAPAAAPLAVNFGPGLESCRPVCDLVEALSRHWGGRPAWRLDAGVHPKEAPLLKLDAALAQKTIGWRPRLTFDKAVEWTADWYDSYWKGGDLRAVIDRQIDEYSRVPVVSTSDAAPAGA
jgi:CDP-glucose 4,6-dehydratase